MNKHKWQNTIEQFKASLKPHWGKKIGVLIGDQQVRETTIQDLKFFGLKKIVVYRSRREFFSVLSTTDPQPDLFFSDINLINLNKPSETGFYLLKTLSDFALEHNFNIEMKIILIARKIDKEGAIECFKVGAKDIVLFPSSLSAFGNKLLKWLGGTIDRRAESEIEKHLLLADDFFRKGEFDEAIKKYDFLLANYGEKADVLEKKGQALLVSGNYEEAIICFKKSVQIKSNFAKAYQGLGDTYVKLMDYEQARVHYRKVLKIEPDNCYAHFNIGEAYRTERKWREAESVFNEGINKKNPNFIFFRIGLAETYVGKKDIDKAVETYKQAIKLKSKNTQISARLADICIENEMYEEAEDVLRQSIDNNERAVVLFNKLGIALRKQRKYQEAINNYLKAIKIDPDDPNLYYNNGKAYLEKGEREKAIYSFRMSIKIDQSMKEALLTDREISSLHREFQ